MVYKLKLAVLVLLFLGISEITFSQVIAQWRGFDRNGIYNEQELMDYWPNSGPGMIWATETIGAGYASPAVTNDKLYVNGEIDSTSYLFVFDLQGKLLWKVPNGKEFFGEGYSGSFPGARSTPTVYGDLVYVSSENSRIACFDAMTGDSRWSVDMVDNLGGKRSQFGYSESLLVDEKLVYCFPGGDQINFAALDRFTGKTIWTSKALGDRASFCSPVFIDLKEIKILVTLSKEYLVGLNCQTGELLWLHKLDSVVIEGEHCNTPVYSDGFIYYTAGDKNGNGAVKLSLSADGRTIKEVWRNRSVDNAFGGIVKTGPYLYSTVKYNKLKCVDVNTGSVVDSMSNVRGSLIYADSLLYCYTYNGEVKLIKSRAMGKMELISKFKCYKGTQEHFSHPVISNGVLYVRHGKALVAYNIRKEKIVDSTRKCIGEETH